MDSQILDSNNDNINSPVSSAGEYHSTPFVSPGESAATRPGGDSLIRLDAFTQALAEAKTIPEAKALADQTDLFRQWLKKQRVGREAQNTGAIMCLQAQRRLGEMLKNNPEITKGSAQMYHHGTFQNLVSLGIDRHASHRWQKLAEIPEDTFQEFIKAYQEVQDEITTIALVRFWAKKTIQPLPEAIPLPEGKFSVIACDPPWQYGTTYNPDSRRVGAPYAEMRFDQLAALDIPAAKGRKRTVKLSWIGTREMARAKGNIALSDPIIEDSDGYLRVVIRATDLKRNVSLFGGCHQLKQMKVKVFDNNGNEMGYQTQDDPHYFSKALSKAQRNVIQSIIPAGFIARMIDKFLVMSGREPLKQLPKPKANKPRVAKELPEVAPAELITLHQLETLAYNRWHIQPAEMYTQLGYKGKADCHQPPWECFLALKAIYEEGGNNSSNSG